MNKADKVLKIVNEQVGYDIKQVIREYAISGLNLPLKEAEEFAMKVSQHLIDGEWLELHLPGKSVQWDRGFEK